MEHSLLTTRPFRAITATIGGILVAVACLVFIGWQENITILKSIFPGIVSMNPHTALCFLLTGISIILLLYVEKKWVPPLVTFFAAIVFTFGFVRMLGILGIIDLHLDQVLFHAQLMQVTAFSNNRIAPNTAFNLILLSFMLLLVAFKRYYIAIQALATLMFFIALLAILGYIYEVHNLYGFLSYTPMALNSAICFLLSSVALSVFLPKGFFLDTLLSPTPGGIIARRLVPTIVVMPLIFGYGIVEGIQHGLFDANYGTALFTVALIAVFLLVVAVVVYRINGLDKERLAAEEETRAARIRVETSREELDKKLKETEQQNSFLEDTKRAMLNLVEDLNITKKDLEREKNKDEALLESIGDAVFAVDEKGIIILFNPVAEELSGVKAKDALGKHYDTVLTFAHEDTGVVNNSFITIALTGKKTSMENHTVLINAAGDHIPVADSASPLTDTNGSVTGAVIVFRDVTHERQVDRAKTEFVSLASHQLRTPLSAIGWYSELLGDEDAGKLNKKQKEFIRQIAESNTRMVQLVNSLLNVSRIDMGTLASDPVLTDIVALAESVLAELAPQIQELHETVIKDCKEDVLQLMVDPQLMRIVLQNLLSNAVKYTPDGGTITFSMSKDANLFHLSVADTGYGIPVEQQGKIFTKLFRADNAKEKITDGNGLGLYVVKSVIETHGGKIWFTSKENEGTTFFVELPASGMQKMEGSKTLAS